MHSTKTQLEDQTNLKKLTFSAGLAPRRSWLAPLVIAGVVFLVVWAFGLWRGPLLLDIGGDDRQDQIYLTTGEGGFFAPEKQQGTDFPAGYDASYRWTGRIAYIDVPWPLDSLPLKATLRATAPRPDRAPDQPGTTLKISGVLGNNSTGLGEYPVSGRYNGDELTFKIPAHLKPALDPLKLRFESSETYQPGKGDIRNLSALFFSLKLEPDYAGFGLKGWLASLLRPALFALLTLCAWGLAGFLFGNFRRHYWRLGLEIVSGVLLVASLLWWPLAAETLYLPWLLILALLWLLLELAGRFALAAPSLPAAFVYSATLLPLLPVMQFIAGRMEFNTINPGAISIVIYGVALLVSLGFYFGARRHFSLVFMAAFLAASGLIFGYSHVRVYVENLYRGGDFRNYYIGLLDLEQFKQPLYDLKDIAQNPGRAIRMPPAFALLFWPVARIAGRNIDLAIFTWRTANELLLIPTLLIFLKLFGNLKPGLKMWPAIVFLVLNFGQLAETTAYGQQNYVLLFTLALTGLFVRQKRDVLAGLVLSAPIWVKLLPAISGAFFLSKRHWRGLVGLAVGALIVNGLTVMVVGWDTVWFYFTRVLWGVNEPELGITNQSWWGFLGRLGVTEVIGDFQQAYPRQLTLLGYLGAIIGLGLTLLVLWRAREGDWLVEQLMLGALALLALWMPPFSWMHYIVPGLVAIVALLAMLSRNQSSRSTLVVFAIAYCLLAYGGRQEFFFGEAVGLNRLGSSYRFLATFALWALNLWLLWSNPSSKAEQLPEKEKEVTQLNFRSG